MSSSRGANSKPPPGSKRSAGAYETSFASKYAHFHDPTAFPIYDSHAVNALKRVTGWQLRPGYANWCKTLEEWRTSTPELRDAELKDLDRFLWLYGMKLAGGAGRPFNAEVRDFFKTERGIEFADDLDPASAA